MSQDSIPESTDSDSQALPADETGFGNLGDIAGSAEKALEDIWESAIIETGAQSIAIEEATNSGEITVEKVAELAAKRSTPSNTRSRVASNPSGATKQATNWQRFQRYWQVEIRPALKEQAIKTLRATIRSLEFLVDRLEAKPAASPLLQGKPPGRQVRGLWGSVLGLTRSRLPRSLNRQLSDSLLSGAIAAMLLLTLWTSSSLIFRKSPTQVAIAPPTKSTPAKPTDSKEKSVLDEQPMAKPTPDVITIDPRPKQTLLTPSQKASDTLVDIAKPFPSPTVTPTPKPPPPLKLTPEQTLIARIQDQVADVSNQYVNGLIQSVQANFRSSLLTVKVGDDWYILEQVQQNKLANEMLKRAQQLDFIKLELTDSQNNLLARSPVVGSEMVILHRTPSLQQTT